MKKSIGKVFLVGAGPGDPDLITEKGKQLLSSADVILYDRLANASLLRLAREDAIKIYVGKAPNKWRTKQSEINRLLVWQARRGNMVVRLKGGDPMLFGRGAEEAIHLANRRIPFEIVPGVSAALAVPLCAGIPLTMRGMSSSVTILTGREADGTEGGGVDWDRLLKADSTFVVLMGVGNLDRIVKRFLAAGKHPRLPAALIESGTTPFQKTVTGPLNRIATLGRKARIASPAILVIGKTVALRKRLRRHVKRPLRDVRVLVTRPERQVERVVRLLERQGAVPLVHPLIRITLRCDFRALDRAIVALTQYDWIIFTSVNGVQGFMHRLQFLGHDSRELAGVKVCAIGPATAAELGKWGINTDCLPEKFTSEGIVGALASRGEIDGHAFLLPRSQIAGDALPASIRRLGGRCVEAVAYKALPVEENAGAITDLIAGDGVDVVMLTSPSAVESYVKALRRIPLKKRCGPIVAVIGPVTGRAARGHGLRVAIEARTHTDEGLVAALVDFWKRKGKALRRREKS